jgi:hypothetical protein
MKKLATLSGFLRVCATALTFVISPYPHTAVAELPQEKVCGGVAGIACPQGYQCEYPEPNFPDAQGVCKKSNQPPPPLPLSGPSPAISLALEYDVDRPGADYRNFDLPQAGAEACRDACADDPQCQAFTYVKPSVQGPNARCWLKQSAPQAGFSSCCVSGVKTGGPSVPTPTGQPTGMNCPAGTALISGQCVSVGPPPEVRPPVVDPLGHPLGMNCPPGTMALGGQCVSTNPPSGIPPPPPLGP